MIIALDGQVLMNDRKSGIGILAHELTQQLIKSGKHKYVICAFSLGRSKEQLERLKKYKTEEIRINRIIHRGIYLRLWRYLPLPYRWMFKGNTDVNIFWNYDTPPGVKGASLTFVHDMTFMAYPETMDDSVRSILKRNMADTCSRADCILTISEFSKREIMKYMNVPENKIRVIYCGVDSSRFHVIDDIEAIEDTKKKYDINGEYFLYVGTLEPRKNLIFLIRAYALAKREAAREDKIKNRVVKEETTRDESVNEQTLKQESVKQFPKLVLGGMKGWHYEGIFAEVTAQGLLDDVVFTDYLPEEDVPLLMNGAAAFVFPSLYEGFGIPPLEAMACGTPVIVSDRASLPEVVQDTGMVVTVEEEESLATAMIDMLNSEIRKTYREKGLEHVKRFTWKHAAEQLLEVIDEYGEKSNS